MKTQIELAYLKKSMSKKPSQLCVKQTTKKYTSRASPAYPGTACCGEIKKGNDGQMYESRKAENGSCRWHPMKTRSQTLNANNDNQ